MSISSPVLPETRVLAIASHVKLPLWSCLVFLQVVSGYVGNKIAVFVLQLMGCDVAALNTVQFSNHTGYRHFTGKRATADDITSLWQGLVQNRLDDFDMILTGYIPGAAAVEAVGQIARELRANTDAAAKALGGFFWVLDPVMGDNGKLYVAEEVVPAYRSLLGDADLILPNQFEAEVLTGIKIISQATLLQAIEILHSNHNVAHVLITSVTCLDESQHPDQKSLSVVGSTMDPQTRKPRPFRISFPVIDAYFCGTGDMFSALLTVRMREATAQADGQLMRTRGWISNSEVGATELPLARATELVVASMHAVLARTVEAMNAELDNGKDGQQQDDTVKHVRKSRAAELRLVRNLDCLCQPKVRFLATKMEA